MTNMTTDHQNAIVDACARLISERAQLERLSIPYDMLQELARDAASLSDEYPAIVGETEADALRYVDEIESRIGGAQVWQLYGATLMAGRR